MKKAFYFLLSLILSIIFGITHYYISYTILKSHPSDPQDGIALVFCFIFTVFLSGVFFVWLSCIFSYFLIQNPTGKSVSLRMIFLFSFIFAGLIFFDWSRFHPTIYPTDKPIERNQIEKLLKKNDHRINWALAENPFTPPDILSRLSNTEDTATLTRLASNPNTPQELLEFFSSSKNRYIKMHLSHNPKIPQALLEKLSQDYDPEVRAAVKHAIQQTNSSAH